MPIRELGEWYYLIYLIPGGAALFILLASVFGGHHRVGGHGHVGGHAHFGGHHAPAAIAAHGHPAQIGPAAAHGDSAPGAGHGSTAAAHAAANHTHAAHNGNGSDDEKSLKIAANGATLSQVHPKVPETFGTFFGMGKVPITMVAGSLCLGWGMFGVYGTEFWQGLTHTPFVFVPLGAVSAAIGGALTGRFMAILGAKMLPQTESFAVTSVELFGCRGNVVYPVDTEHGRVHVYDGYGTMHDKEARTRTGAIPRGHAVLVLDFDYDTDRLIVEEAPNAGR